jgi:hypothetical protein
MGQLYSRKSSDPGYSEHDTINTTSVMYQSVPILPNNIHDDLLKRTIWC